jgi:hypothetical protein
MRLRALTLVACCTVTVAACVDPTRGFDPTVERAVVLSSAPHGEFIELRPQWMPGIPEQLVPEYVVNGALFSLHVRQELSADGTQFLLELAIRNSGNLPAWRPVRLRLAAILPRHITAIPSDAPIGQDPVWDYSQTVGLDGVLAPGETSGTRHLAFPIPGAGPSSLRAFRITAEITARGGWTIPPTVDREPTPAEIQTGYGEGMLIIRYRGGRLSPAEIGQINIAHGLVAQEYDDILGIYVAFIEPPYTRTSDVLTALLANPAVELVTLAPIVRAQGFALPLNSENNSKWDSEGFTLAWQQDESAGRLPGQDVVVGVIDDGIASHPELLSRIARWVDVRNTAFLDPRGGGSHGTMVASILAAESNGSLVAGGAYGAKIVSIRVCGLVCWPWDFARGLKYVANSPDISIVNVSMGAAVSLDYLVGSAFDDIARNGTLVVAAAGNHTWYGNRSVNWPATRTDVLAVAALSSETQLWTESAFGSEIDISALGTSIPLVVKGVNNEIFFGDGTSFAAPRVVAAAAILKAREPTVNASGLRTLLEENTVDIGPVGKDSSFGIGRLKLQGRGGRCLMAFLADDTGVTQLHNALLTGGCAIVEYDTDVDGFTAQELSGASLTMLNLLGQTCCSAQPRVSATQAQAYADFVNAGGTLLLTSRAFDYQYLNAVFGLAPSGADGGSSGFNWQLTPRFAFPIASHPLFVGVSSMHGDVGEAFAFTAAGALAWSVIMRGASNEPLLAVRNYGAGQVVLWWAQRSFRNPGPTANVYESDIQRANNLEFIKNLAALATN